MPDFLITSPEGAKYKVTAPDGATQQEILDFVQDHHAAVADTLPPISTTPKEQRIRDTSGPPNDAQRARDLYSGTHDAPTLAYTPGQQALPAKFQLFYDAAENDVERFKVLTKAYGKDVVGRDQYGLYVKLPSGRQVYPKTSVLSSLATSALPTAGAIAGGVMGSAAGPLGTAGGAAAGAVAGQAVDDLIMRAFDFYDRTPAQEAEGLGISALTQAVSDGAGPLLRAGAQAVGRAGTSVTATIAGKVFDLDPVAAQRAAELVRQGLPVNPAGYMRGAKRIGRVIEMSRKLGYDPTAAGEGKLAKQSIIDTFTQSGLTPEQATQEYERLKTVAQTSLRPAGEALRDAARRESVEALATREAREAELRAGAQKAGEQAVADRARDMAILQRNYSVIQRDLDTTIQKGLREFNAMVAAPRTPAKGGLSLKVSGKIRERLRALQDQATKIYEPGLAIAGDVPIPTADLAHAAHDFLNNLPESLGANFPAMVRRLKFLTGDATAATENDTIGSMNLRQLQYLRTQLRDMGYNPALTPDFKKGSYQYLADAVNRLMHDPGNEMAVREGVKLIDQGDAFYRRVMPQFKNATISAIVADARDGLPMDARAVARLVAEPGEGAALRQIFALTGPETREHIAQAFLEDLQAKSRVPLSDILDPKAFFEAVGKAHSDKTLQLMLGPEKAAKVVTFARRLALKHDVIPLDYFQGAERDAFVQRVEDARIISEQIGYLAKRDPIKLMRASMADAETRISTLRGEFKAAQQQNVLRFLNHPQTLAEPAAREVLNSEELTEIVGRRFPQEGPGMPLTALRQYVLESMLGPLVRGEGSKAITTGLEKLTAKQQAVLFPDSMAQDLNNIVEGLKVMHGSATGTVPGFAAGQLLGQDPLGSGGLSAAGKIQAIYYALAWGLTRPAVNRRILAGFARDLEEKTPLALDNAYRRSQAILGTAGALMKRGGGVAAARSLSGNAGTPEGQAQLPPVEQREGEIGDQ
jgi:hypothetical protein